jgi:hypothetical protein
MANVSMKTFFITGRENCKLPVESFGLENFQDQGDERKKMSKRVACLMSVDCSREVDCGKFDVNKVRNFLLAKQPRTSDLQLPSANLLEGLNSPCSSLTQFHTNQVIFASFLCSSDSWQLHL